MDCLFCKIAAGEIPSERVYENEHVFAIHDIAPKAPVHVLIIPKAHVMASAAEADGSNSEIFSHIFLAAAEIARQLGLKDGFRVVTNSGEHGGQTVPHLHFHLLGGSVLGAEA